MISLKYDDNFVISLFCIVDNLLKEIAKIHNFDKFFTKKIKEVEKQN